MWKKIITGVLVFLSICLICMAYIGINIYDFFKNSTFEFNYYTNDSFVDNKILKIEADFDLLLNENERTDCFMKIMDLNTIESGSYFDKEGLGRFEIKHVFIKDSLQIKENIDLFDCVDKASFYYES